MTENEDTGKHYRFEYRGIKLDPARIVTVYGCKNLMAGTIVKKALLAGHRGKKSEIDDVNDIITAAMRWKEMLLEDMADKLDAQEGATRENHNNI